jgi:hypothetical protein
LERGGRRDSALKTLWGFDHLKGGCRNTDLTDRSRTALFLGAGFSYAAGMPLTNDLLCGDTYATSKAAVEEWNALLDDYGRWSANNPLRGVEEYLAELYSLEVGNRAHLWPIAVRLIAATLGAERHGEAVAGRARYASMITRSYRDQTHRAFWDVVLHRFNVSGVVTTNYDVLIERSLRHRPMKYRPGFHYGGFPVPLEAIGWVNPYRPSWDRERTVIRGHIPLFKLHGSVNWFVEYGHIEVYSDTRPSFRLKKVCSIVPPTPHKDIPRWLKPVWDGAHKCLSEVDQWIVCGYSLPEYDAMVRDLLRTSVSNPKTVVLLDPNSGRDKERWGDLLRGVTVVPLPGLPEGITLLRG